MASVCRPAATRRRVDPLIALFRLNPILPPPWLTTWHLRPLLLQQSLLERGLVFRISFPPRSTRPAFYFSGERSLRLSHRNFERANAKHQAEGTQPAVQGAKEADPGEEDR